MQLLFRTWNHIIPLAIVKNKNLKLGDVVEIRGRKYVITCEPNGISPSRKRHKFYYCVKASNEYRVTNTV